MEVKKGEELKDKEDLPVEEGRKNYIEKETWEKDFDGQSC